MNQIALAQKPFNVPVGQAAQFSSPQGRAFVAIPARVGTMALRAMIAIDQSTGGNGIRLSCQRICTGMILRRHMIPVRVRRYRQSRAQSEAGESKIGRPHRAPPVAE